LLSGPTEREVPLRDESSTTVVENVDDVENCKRYKVAPEEAFHVKVGLIETSMELLAGELSVGAAGGATTVVKLFAEEYELVPPAFVALTRQKYFVLFCNPVTLYVVVAILL